MFSFLFSFNGFEVFYGVTAKTGSIGSFTAQWNPVNKTTKGHSNLAVFTGSVKFHGCSLHDEINITEF